MNDQNYVYSPEYESYVFRAFYDPSQFVSFILFLIWNVACITGQFGWGIIILINAIFFVNIIGIPIKYIYYIGSFIINENQGTIKIVQYRFDKIIQEIEIQIENADVKIIEHWFYRRPIVELRLYSNGKFICKQRESRKWTIESFKEIKKITMELQQNIRQNKNT